MEAQYFVLVRGLIVFWVYLSTFHSSGHQIESRSMPLFATCNRRKLHCRSFRRRNSQSQRSPSRFGHSCCFDSKAAYPEHSEVPFQNIWTRHSNRQRGRLAVRTSFCKHCKPHGCHVAEIEIISEVARVDLHASDVINRTELALDSCTLWALHRLYKQADSDRECFYKASKPSSHTIQGRPPGPHGSHHITRCTSP